MSKSESSILSEEKAFFLITELLSSLSFGFDGIFETEGGFINPIEKFNWEEIQNSAAGKRRLMSQMKVNELSHVLLLKNETQIKLARLYRIGRSAHNIYTQILFFWYCLCYPENNEEKAVNWINRRTNDQEEIQKILASQDLAKEKFETIGEYIRDGVRNSIAHIQRHEKKQGKSLTLDSLKENRHLHEVKVALKKMVRYRLEYEYEIKITYDSAYFECFIPQ